jgi:hypothetical protein
VKFKTVFRRDGLMVRLFRVMWTRGTVGDGKGYSCKFSVAVRPTLFRWRRELGGWLLTLAGVRLHFDRSYGGIHG